MFYTIIFQQVVTTEDTVSVFPQW